MCNAITVFILGDDGKDDGLNIEDDDEHTADNPIKLSKKVHLPQPLPLTMYIVITYLYSR